MIGTRTPFRISFAGGGSDLRSFYSKCPGCVLSTTIDKYMYILIHPYFDDRIQVKYSRTELVNSIAHIQHPIVRVALGQFGTEGVDINSIADIPAGTGLGSSSSFTVGLLHALYAYTGQFASKELLARKACEIEIDILKDPIGKQDMYAAAYGGLNLITFYPDESVQVEPVIMPPSQRSRLAQNLLAFYLGGARSAHDILADQQSAVLRDRKKFEGLMRMVELARQLRESLAKGCLDDMGPILHENWLLKKQLSSQISTEWIDACYDRAMQNGATGGKLLGAGGCGFLLLYCDVQHQDRLRAALSDLREIKFSFDNFGTRVIYYEDGQGRATLI
ncbi:MAG: GHMP kinase [Thermoguttaceae bacterium]|jgi:D-glycero-alpha-D-manno-heptose-7-phosphate kinase